MINVNGLSRLLDRNQFLVNGASWVIRNFGPYHKRHTLLQFHSYFAV